MPGGRSGLYPGIERKHQTEEYKQYEAESGLLRAVGRNRLVELAQAEQDGRLVVLPCKVGTPVWEIGDFDGGNLKRRPFCVEDMSFWRFGTTVFLTREAAEAALKKREEADNETG